MNTVETRIPSAANWARVITAVSEKAKTGHDWEGEFVKGGSLIDLEPGSIVITCDGKRTKEVTVSILRDSGKWVQVEHIISDEWAYGLRKDVREWLALSTIDRISRAYEVRAIQIEKEVATWEKYQTDILDHMREQAKTKLPQFQASLALCRKNQAAWLASIAPQSPEQEIAQVNTLASVTTEALIAELHRRGVAV